MRRIAKTDSYRLAMLPIAYLGEQDDMFEGYCEPAGVAEAYRDVFTSALWAYQLYTYRELVRDSFGQQMALQVWGHQFNVLEQTAGTGQLVQQAFDVIAAARDLGPTKVSVSWGDVDVPPEMNVALALLLRMPESPLFAESTEQFGARVAARISGTHWCLCDCLVRAQARMRRVFAALLTRSSDPARRV